MFATVEKAIEELRQGKAIIVVDDENRENEGDFVALAEFATPEMINFMATEGRGLICVPINQQKCDQLALIPMVSANTDVHGTAFTVSIDHADVHTGISAFERSETILRMLDQTVKPTDFRRPGHIFPLMAKEGGVLTRAGHTEAAVDLAILSGAQPAGVICEIMNADGTMATGEALEKIANKHDLVILTIEQIVAYRKKNEVLIERIVDTHLPTAFGDFTAYTYVETLTGKEHIAFVKGCLKSADSPLVRIHSECLTGDVFGSCRCDCGPQLHAALEHIEEAGVGVLLYMRQEGRGIGLVNKMKAYKLQEQGYDTVEANALLGFDDDLREYYLSAQILTDLSCTQIKLLTNNPRKIKSLQTFGITITKRIQLEVPVQQANEKYMHTKQIKMGHLLNL